MLTKLRRTEGSDGPLLSRAACARCCACGAVATAVRQQFEADSPLGNVDDSRSRGESALPPSRRFLAQRNQERTRARRRGYGCGCGKEQGERSEETELVVAVRSSPSKRSETMLRTSLRTHRYVVLEFDKNEVLIDALGGDLSSPTWMYRADLYALRSSRDTE